MAKVKVPVYGTVGKTIFFDPQAGERAEAAVEALAQAISLGVGGVIPHRTLLELGVGDDHPQYAMWQAPETIEGLWNFSTIPLIQGETLAEYIEDVVGGDIFDFLQDTSSVVWTYHETANELEANVPPEFVQDTVGAMLSDTSSIDLDYNDGAGTFTASIIDEYVQDLVGAMFVDSTTIDFTYSDVAGTVTAAVIESFSYTWTANHRWTDSDEAQFGTDGDLRIYHNGTNGVISNDTGALTFPGNVNALKEVTFLNSNAGTGAYLQVNVENNAGNRLIFGMTSSVFTGANNVGFLQVQGGTLQIGAGSATTTLDSTATLVARQFRRTNVISPAQLVANTNNWAPTGLGTAATIRFSTDASRDITGIVAQGAGTEILLINIGAQNAVLVHNATSTAANQFLCPGAVNFTLNAGDACWIWYDTTSARWRVIAY